MTQQGGGRAPKSWKSAPKSGRVRCVRFILLMWVIPRVGYAVAEYAPNISTYAVNADDAHRKMYLHGQP